MDGRDRRTKLGHLQQTNFDGSMDGRNMDSHDEICFKLTYELPET